MKEKRARSIIKAISWRFFATLTTAIIVYFFTGNFMLSIGVSIVEVFSKIGIYYAHERIWNKVKFGIDGK